MSAGHGSRRKNLHHHAELAKLKKQGGYPELWKRWQNLSDQYDIPDLAGYNVAGTERYLDKDFFKALFDPQYATQILGAPIDTGLSPENTVVCIIEHEGEEKVLTDADNNIDLYENGHEMATAGEHERVRQLGGKPVQYERGLKAAIKFCANKKPQKVPPDYACAPYLDEPDATDQRILKELQRLGVIDAGKESKANVQYDKSTGKDRCDGCANWQPDPQQAQFGLARCAIVAGLVRQDRWCSKFEATPPPENANVEEPQEGGPDSR